MPHLPGHLRTVVEPDGGVILDTHQGKIIRCNRTGAAILELLSRGCDREQLTAEFSRLYEISPTDADADVRAFLDALQRQGLLCSEIADLSQE